MFARIFSFFAFIIIEIFIFSMIYKYMIESGMTKLANILAIFFAIWIIIDIIIKIFVGSAKSIIRYLIKY
jgi:heme A synthase